VPGTKARRMTATGTSASSRMSVAGQGREGWKDAAMDTGKAEHEARALEEVVERLVARFPDVAEDRVREIVRAAHEEFANRPIRDYVPVFVERTAQDELNRLTTT